MKDRRFWGVAGVLLLLYIVYTLAGSPGFKSERSVMFFAVMIMGGTVIYYIRWARRGEPIHLRTIPGLKAVEEAVGRATEMGRPVLYVPGIMDMDQVETVAGVIILGHVAKTTARYDIDLKVPVARSIVMKAAREACRESYISQGVEDRFREDQVYYLTDDQFAYAAGVNGAMLREKPASCLYMGKFYAESLLLAETGNQIGAIQIAGTASPPQIPFFVTACDYTLIGEEFFAASAYLSQRPELLGGVKGQDMLKVLLVAVMLLATILSFIYDLGWISWSVLEFLTVQ